MAAVDRPAGSHRHAGVRGPARGAGTLRDAAATPWITHYSRAAVIFSAAAVIIALTITLAAAVVR